MGQEEIVNTLKGCDVTALDASEKMCKIIEKYAGVTADCGKVEDVVFRIDLMQYGYVRPFFILQKTK